MMQRSKPPLTRAEFERRLQLLREGMRGGRIHFGPAVSHSIEGLRRVRYLPNHRIDLLTVDEMTRLNANTIAQFTDDERFPEVGGSEPESAATTADGDTNSASSDDALLTGAPSASSTADAPNEG